MCPLFPEPRATVRVPDGNDPNHLSVESVEDEITEPFQFCNSVPVIEDGVRQRHGDNPSDRGIKVC
jgi:hypothetical protein